MLTSCLLLALCAVLCLSSFAAASLEYDPSTPLLLTPYLDNATARAQGVQLSLVTSFPDVYSPNSPTTVTPLPFTQHSGYFSINPDCSLFFQLFSPNNSSTPLSQLPLIVFLAGGPGLAATYWTLYGGVTPLTFSPSPTPRLLYADQSWAEDAHVLLIDSPISVGFSQCSAGHQILAANNSVATAHLLTFMRQFFTLYDDLAKQPLFIAGHSYGGRSAPDLAQALAVAKYPVAGVIVESGVTQSYLSFSETCNAVYLQGLFNYTERHLCNDALHVLKGAVEEGDEVGAGAAISIGLAMVRRANGNGNAYQDWQRTFNFANIDTMTALVNSSAMRTALHAGSDTPYAALPGYEFSDHWSGESVTSLDSVLSSSGTGRVLYFASNKDSLLGASTQRLLAATQYNQRVAWNNTQPEALRQTGRNETRGLLKRDARLWFATLYDASHEISIMQPTLVRQLIASFTRATSSDYVASSYYASKPTQSQKLLNTNTAPIDQPTVDASLHPLADDVSPPVYLTPYLSMTDGAALAQQASAVTLPHDSVLAPNTTHSGYITIDATLNSHSFFWFLPSLDGNSSAPLILHLSGGPGISSMAMGFLYQHGPFAVNDTYSNSTAGSPLDTHYRADNYNEHNHMLYVDNPIGTGFSYTESSLGLRNDSRQVADDLYELLRQFYLLFPAYRQCRLYIHGVSYAGHFLPTLGYKIHTENLARDPEEHMPFEGLFIAAPYMDSNLQNAEEDEFLISIGRMDPDHRNQYVGCDDSYCDLDPYNYPFGDAWRYEEAGIMRYLSHPLVVSALHAGPRGLTVRSSNNSVSRTLQRTDQPVKPEVEALLASGYYQIVMYAAEYDVVCWAAGVTNFIAALDYTATTQWETAATKVWWPQPNRPASQSRQPPHTSPLQPWQPQPQGIWWSSSPHHTLHHAMIRFAGHLVEHTHLYQAGQIIQFVQSWPTLPKTGGPDEPTEGEEGSGVGRAAILLLIIAVVVALGAFVQMRQDRQLAKPSARGTASPSLSTALLGEDEKFNNSQL